MQGPRKYTEKELLKVIRKVNPKKKLSPLQIQNALKKLGIRRIGLQAIARLLITSLGVPQEIATRGLKINDRNTLHVGGLVGRTPTQRSAKPKETRTKPTKEEIVVLIKKMKGLNRLSAIEMARRLGIKVAVSSLAGIMVENGVPLSVAAKGLNTSQLRSLRQQGLAPPRKPYKATARGVEVFLREQPNVTASELADLFKISIQNARNLILQHNIKGLSAAQLRRRKRQPARIQRRGK